MVATIELLTYENNGFTCVGDPETFTITVNWSPVEPGHQEICPGESTDEIIFTTTNTDGTTTYAWTSDNTEFGLDASGDGNMTLLLQFSYYISNCTIVVTPTYENDGVT